VVAAVDGSLWADEDGGSAVTEVDIEREQEASDVPSTTQPTPPLRARWMVAGLTFVAGVVPFAVALAVVRRPRWYPEMDIAMTELLVRDVGTGDTPLVGLIGRVYGLDVRGYHPGPLSFWALTPVYRLLGSTAWALQASAAALNVLAMGTAIWIGHRRGGRAAAIGVAALVTILALKYDTDTLIEPWNPYIPRLWWFVLLLAAWSVLCDDLAMLPVAVGAASLATQTHISYVGLVGAIGGVVAVGLAIRQWPRRREPGRRRRVVRWVGGSLALACVLWLPPVIEQLTASPGNVSVIVDSFADPTAEPLGLNRLTAERWLSYLDVAALLGRGDDDVLFIRHEGSGPGLVLLAVWAGAAAWSWRRRLGPDLLALHVVTGAALGAGLLSMSRIHGGPIWWVVLWAWATTAVVVIAVAWTIALMVQRRLPPPKRAAAGTAGTVLVTSVLVVAGAAFTYQARHTDLDRPEESRSIGQLASQTVSTLERGDAPGPGLDGRYQLRWDPDLLLSGLPYGLLLELERNGVDVGMPERLGIPYRQRVPRRGDQFLDYVVGEADLDRWRARPGTVEVATYDDPVLGPMAMFLSDVRVRDEVPDP
jgi:heme/copper-type cytochrome/quinol oxidase subunit 2